ncbi:MAG: alpha/beta hydrolase, partial [Pseudomonadota bacterium]
MTNSKKTIASATLATALMSSTALASDIQTRTVAFESNGAAMAGTLYLPADHDGSALPTVIVTGAWTTVQQQMPATYAREMAARGYAAFTFDFRGWGQSDDLPQNVRFE